MRWTCIAVFAVGEVLKTTGGSKADPTLYDGTCAPHSAKTHSAECAETAAGGFAEGPTESDITIHSIKDCAQTVQEKCGDKAVYVAFHEGQTGFMNGETECLWFTTCACTDHDPPNCDKTDGLTTQFKTAKISELLAPAAANGDGSEPPASASDPLVDPNKIPGTVKDPTVTMNEAAALLKDAGTPAKAELMTIPDATEIDMKMLRENPKAMFTEAKKVGQVEPACPDDYEAAKMRGEWQCLKRRKPINEVTTWILMAGVGVCCICTCMFHLVGRRIRAGKKGDDMDGEQEEEEEEYTEE